MGDLQFLAPDPGAFHFLRPWWLAVIPAAVWLHLRLRRAYSAAAQWRKAIAPHLLIHLTVVGRDSGWLRPYQIMTAALLLASLALAGPAWQREITPFTQDHAPLVVALELTPTMLAVDQAPSRLERAKHKIRDLLEHRTGARTALIGYAGSAHAVLPLTSDTGLIEIYLESLMPAVMPAEGDDATAALALAETFLAAESVAGTILFLTDGIDRSHESAFRDHREASEDQVLILALGTTKPGKIQDAVEIRSSYGLVDGQAPGLNLTGLEAIADVAGTSVLRATADTADIDVLVRGIRNHLSDTIRDDQDLQWRDAGYLLVWPLALLILLWARSGWTVQWL